jgi:hypothetical protein
MKEAPMSNFLDRDRMKLLSRVPGAGGFRTPQFGPASETESRRERELPLLSGYSQSDEVLIVDARACLRPAQLVERKLLSLLKSVYLPVSHVRTTSLGNGRGHFSAASPQPDREMNRASAADHDQR